jgi:hypothetical protein
MDAIFRPALGAASVPRELSETKGKFDNPRPTWN